MSKKHFSLIIAIACLLSFATVLASSSTVQAQSDTPEGPTALTPAISSTQIDGTVNTTHSVEAMNCNGEKFTPQNRDFEQRLIVLVNTARAERNLPPMKSSDALNYAARYHARDMAEDDYFDHQTYDRVNGELTLACAWNTRVKRYYGDYMRLGENIAVGYPTPESVFQGWMDSDGHRGNILHPHYREIGVGQYDTYWSQVFGERENVYPVIINDDFPETNSQNIDVYAYGEWDQIRLRNDAGQWSDWRSFKHNLDWTLPAVTGSRTVEAEMRRSGSTSVNSSDSINFVGDDGGSGNPAHAVNSVIFLPVINR